MCKWYPRHGVPAYVFVFTRIVFVVLCLSGHPRSSSEEALVYRGSLPGPNSVPSDAQAGWHWDKAPTLCGCCCCVVVVVVCLFTSRSRVSWNTYRVGDMPVSQSGAAMKAAAVGQACCRSVGCSNWLRRVENDFSVSEQPDKDKNSAEPSGRRRER